MGRVFLGMARKFSFSIPSTFFEGNQNYFHPQEEQETKGELGNTEIFHPILIPPTNFHL